MNEQPQGALAQVARPAATPAPSPAQAAIRAAGMDQEPATPQDYFTKSMQDLRTQRQTLDSQIEKMRASLDSRMGLPFDPILMRAAAGFAKPTKTGSFLESAGYAMEGAADEAERQIAREQATQKLRLDLEQKALAAKEAGLGMEHLMSLAGGQMPGVPQMGAAVPRSEAAPTQMAAAPGAVTTTGAPRQVRSITDADIAAAYGISKEHGDKVREIAKIQREDIISTPEGPFSRSQQRYIETDPYQAKIVERDFPVIGPKKIPGNISREFDRVLSEVERTGNEDLILDFYAKQGWIARRAQTGERSSTLGLPERPRTPTEEAAEKERLGETMKVRAKAAEEAGNTMLQRGREAYTNRQIAADMSSYATSNPRVFELMQNTSLKDSVLRAIEQGIQAGQFGSFSIPVRTIQQYKLKPEDVEALQMFMQASARLTVQLRKTSRVPGEGAITENEGKLYATVEALPTDTARVIRLKSELLDVRSQYDDASAKLWADFQDKNPGKSFTQFELSDDYRKLKHDYNEQLNVIRKANAELLRVKPSQAPRTSGGDIPEGYTRDSTGVIRKKRQGE